MKAGGIMMKAGGIMMKAGGIMMKAMSYYKKTGMKRMKRRN